VAYFLATLLTALEIFGTGYAVMAVVVLTLSLWSYKDRTTKDVIVFTVICFLMGMIAIALK